MVTYLSYAAYLFICLKCSDNAFTRDDTKIYVSYFPGGIVDLLRDVFSR